VIGRIDALIREGTLSRFGPLFNVERLGGAFVLAAMAVPSERFDVVAETVNSFPEVAHNYARDHELNMWFVLAAERPERVDEVIEEIEQATGLPVYAFPKLEEFYVGLRLSA
jgi:DNA-binding Lrp family transcriptional regulator